VRCGNAEISVVDIDIPGKGVGYSVRVSGDPFAGESGFRPDQYLCHFSRPGELGQARVAEWTLAHPAVSYCTVGLRSDAREPGKFPSSKNRFVAQ
jgi:hypothetical protein